MIAILDYGAGNLRSVERALLHAGAKPKVTDDPEDLIRANGIILPGVGAFAPALSRLQSGNLGRLLVEQVARGKPLFGVCLGFQLLFEASEEHGVHQGLGLLDGRVVEMKDSPRLPVIGWCKVRPELDHPLWASIGDSSYFYFVHSFSPGRSQDVIGSTGHAPVAAAARRNVMGTQFHPEKSGAAGLQLYANFLEVCGAG